MSRFLSNGLRFLFGGARRGQSGLAGLGAAMTIYGWLKQRRGPKRELLWARNLKDGESIRVHMVRGEVVGVDVGTDE